MPDMDKLIHEDEKLNQLSSDKSHPTIKVIRQFDLHKKL